MANKRKEPTKKQKDYAASIAKTLNIKLPEENTSAAYRDFIEKNQERFSQSRVRAVHYTDEQIARANAVDILDYARSQGLELKRDGKDYRVKNYSGGFIITPEKNNWNWFDGNVGGGVVRLCMFLENKTWQEAVGTLLNEDMEPIRRRPDWKPVEEPPKEFHLPERNDTNKHVYAYLTKTRGIDTEIVKKMLDQGYIYENQKRSCVFVGRDKEGVPRHASVRSTNTVGDAYKKDVSGSQKKFSFSISGTSGNLNVFEAPIDALSYMSLQKMEKKPVNDSYLALGGVTDKALEQYLIDHKDIRKITVCTDGDEAGEKAAERIKERYGTDYEIVRQRSSHKDFNEDLINIVQEENFKRNLHEVVSGKSRVSDSILIGTTPNILVACGATKGVDFTISKTVIDKCMRPEMRNTEGKLVGRTGHGLTEEQLYSGLMNVKEPVMVLKGNRENSLVVITEYSDDKNRPIVVSIVLDKKSGRTMINNVSSVYGRDKFEEYIQRQMKADNILAIDNKKAELLLQPIGKWYPKRGEVISYDETIAYSMESVKYPENIQSKKDEKETEMVVNEGIISDTDQTFVLTGAKVSTEMQKIIKRLNTGEDVTIDEINATKEIQYCRSISDNGRETYLLNGRTDKQNQVMEYMENLGSASGRLDKDGKMIYDGDVRKGSRLDIVIGLPGAGKSSALVNVISQEFHSKVIDNDMAKEQFTEYQDGLGAKLVHTESQMVCEKVFAKSIMNGENLVLPKVGSNSDKLIEKIISKAKQFGYEINVHFVDLERDKALGRMLGRLISDGRFLDPALLDKYCPDKEHNHCEQSYEALKLNELINGYSRWDNNVAKGEQPFMVENHNLTGEYINNARVKEEGVVDNDRIGLRNNRDGEQGISENDGEYGRMGESSVGGVYENGTGNLSGRGRSFQEGREPVREEGLVQIKPAKQETDGKPLDNDTAKKENMVKLQGIPGYQKGTPAKDLKIGDVVVWNGGVTSEVVGLEPSKTGKTILFQMKSGEDGVVRDRRMKAGTLVVVQEKAEEQPEPNESEKIEKFAAKLQQHLHDHNENFNESIGVIVKNLESENIADYIEQLEMYAEDLDSDVAELSRYVSVGAEEEAVADDAIDKYNTVMDTLVQLKSLPFATEHPEPDISISNYESNEPGQIDFDVNIEDEVHKGQAGFEDDGTVNWVFVDPVPLNTDKKGMKQQDSAKVELDWDKIIEKVTKLLQDLWNKSKEFVHTLRSHTNSRTYTQTVQSGAPAESGNFNQTQQRSVQNASQDKSSAEQEKKPFDNAGVKENEKGANAASTGSDEIPEAAVTSETPSDVTEQNTLPYYLDFTNIEIKDGYLHFTIETPNHDKLQGTYRIVWSEDGKANELINIRNSYRYPELKEHWKEIRNECQKNVNAHDEYIMENNFQHYIGEDEEPWPLNIGQVPNLLVICGVSNNLRFDISQDIIAGTLKQGITEEQLMNALNNVKNPVMVIQGKEENSFIVVTDYCDNQGHPIMISLEERQEKGFNRGMEVKGVYSQREFAAYVANQVADSKVLAVDHSKADALFQSLEEKSPVFEQVIRFDESIAYDKDSVKTPPTKKQFTFAKQIAETMSLKLPEEYSKEAYAAFIGDNAEEFKNTPKPKDKPKDEAKHETKKADIPFQSIRKNDTSEALKKLQDEDRINTEVIEELEKMEKTEEVSRALSEAYEERKRIDERTVELTWNTNQQEKAAEYRSFSDNHKQFISERKANHIPIVINAFGGPGSGKSASCMDICQQLKKQGYNAEYVQEYAKELVYDENREMLDGTPEHQFEVLKEQLRRVDRLYGSVDFIVTDSPTLLNGVYNKELTPEYDSMVTALYNDFENCTYFVERDASVYQQEGRIQNVEESQKIDQDVKQLLKDKDIYYETYNHDTIDKIVSNSIRTFNRVNHIEEAATQKQIAYAKKIAGALNIDLPEEATKAAYKSFISEHQEAFSQNSNPLMEKEAGAYQYKDYLDMVTQNGSKLKDVPKENYTDELLLAAVSNWGAAIQFIPEEKITKDIAMASVRQYGPNLKHVPAGFRSEEICIAAYISSSGKSLRYTPGDIKAQVKEQGQKQLAEDNNANPNTKRQMEVEQLNKQGQEWLSQIDNMLKEHEADPEAMIEDIAFASKFYQYSTRNIQLMLRQNPGITYVASASTFEKMGYHVKENETPMLGRVPVYAKYITNEKDERVYSWNYTPEIRQKLKEGTLTEEQALRKFQFVAAFFDISQTDCPAEDYPSVFHMGVPSELHQEAFDAMKEFAESLGFKVMVTDLKSISLRGNCEPDKKIIRINDRLESTMALSTLCHEIAHGIIHTSENSAKQSTAQKECEADVMDIMLETSLGLPINESRRNHLFNSFNAYKKEQATKVHPYEVTLEKLIDRVQKDVFRPYAEDINSYLDRHLPAEGIQNEKEAEAVIKNIALLDSVYETDHGDYIDGKNELFDAGRMENYQELYQQTKEKYRLNNSFVPKLATFQSAGNVYNLCDVRFLDETIADLLKASPEAITPEVLPVYVGVGDILALKENVLENSKLYQVTRQGLEDITETLQEKFVAGFMENRINCGFDAVTEYECIHNLLQNNIELEPMIMKRYDYLCEAFDFPKNTVTDSSMQLMARVNLVTEGLSQNNRELVAEYVFRTGNFKKAEEYAEKLEKEPGITKKLLQEMKLVDSYKYMLWTIAEYENSNAVSEENRITTGAYNTSAIPVLSENVHSLSQINESFLLIRKHASPESTKYYAIARNQDGYRIAYVELNGYQPEITYSAVTFADYEEAKEFYNQYLETSNSRLVDETQVGELAALEHKENQVALSDITTIGKTIASQKYQYKEPGMSEESALELLRLDIKNEYPDIRPIESAETAREIQVLKDFKTRISSYGEEHFIELCNLKDFTDTAVMEESIQLAGWLTEQKDVLDNINITGMDDVKQCVNAALECSVTAADIEQAFNVIDSAVLSSEFSGLETEFEGFEEYNNVLDTLKASHVTPDKFCYADYDAAPGPFLYTSDLAGNIYRKSLRNEWNGSVRELYTGLKENGYEICTSLDDFKAYAANNRLGIVNAPEKEKNEAYIRILESTSDMLPKDRILSIYDFKNTMDKLYSGSKDFHEGITYKLVTRKDQEIHSYIDTYSGNNEQNVFEQLYGKVQEQVPELSKVISKQYYQDQVNFNENHLVRPLMVQLKKQQKPVADSEELNALMDSNDKLKEEIKKLDLSPADAELLKLNAGNIQTEQIANIARQQQMDQQIRQQKVRNQQQMEISV